MANNKKTPTKAPSVFYKSNTYIEAEAAEIDPHAEKTPEDIQKITRSFNSHFIFISLTDEDKETVANHMQLYKLDSGGIVFEQWQPSKNYFIVRSGTLEVIINSKTVARITAGEGFGELALIHDTTRSATVKAVDKVEL